ncbi:glutamine--fructose-6-phosphate transaminase (isomerizing), partial [Nanoarchaeota archaeon]
STKSYTSQVAILTLLAYSTAGNLKQGKELITQATTHVDHIIDDNLKKLKTLADRLKNNHNMFLIGRDLAFPSALEGALKIKEVS